MNEFLRRCGHCPCGASASYMFVKRKTLRGIKTSSLQCGFCKVPCSLQYLKREWRKRSAKAKKMRQICERMCVMRRQATHTGTS
jgi:hypothetical protein